MTPRPVMVSWSSGKDSAWALHELRQQPDQYDVRGIFTTVTPHFDRVSIQATPRRVLRLQAERLGLPLYEIPIPYPCPNEAYEAAMRQFLDEVRQLPTDLSADTFAFGDLFLEDIREYREANLVGTGFDAIFPVWGMPTRELAQTMLRSGLKAIVTAVSPTSKLDRSFAGRWFDQSFLDDLPEGTDPLGENGEFHTCVVDGPMFSRPIAAQAGEVVGRPVSRNHDGTGGAITAWYADVELLGD
ncbi:MAG: adenine nucleotide alpha hydrolase [Chloroflexota bacterium]|nr:adenine nucleotide alpha hydrolase [Chloroflexota bacterium]